MAQDTSEALLFELATPANIDRAINALLERHKDKLSQSGNFCVVFFWAGNQLEFYLYRPNKPITEHLRRNITECLNLGELFFNLPGEELKSLMFTSDLNSLWQFAREFNSELGRLFIGSYLESTEDFTSPKGLDAHGRLLYELLDSKAKCYVRIFKLIKHLFDRRHKLFKQFKSHQELFETTLKQERESIFLYLLAVDYAEFKPREIARRLEYFIQTISEDKRPNCTETLQDKILTLASKKNKSNKTQFLLRDYNNARRYHLSCLKEFVLYRNNQKRKIPDLIYNHGSLKPLQYGHS